MVLGIAILVLNVVVILLEMAKIFHNRDQHLNKEELIKLKNLKILKLVKIFYQIIL